MNNIQQKKQELINELDLLWGEAPEGSLKHQKGQAIKALFIKSLEEMQKITIEEIKLNVISLGVYEVNKEGMLNLLSQLSNPAKEKNE